MINLHHYQLLRLHPIIKLLSLSFPLFLTFVSLTLVSCGDDDDSEGSSPKKEKSYLKCPDENHPHLIDLGLPSGTKWACCNVGAKEPLQWGDYYAWGETHVKDIYLPESYTYERKFIGMTIYGTQYDAARVKWGDAWQMPSEAQIEELASKCDFNDFWDDELNHCITKVIGPNGGTLFLPNTGYKIGQNVLYRDYFGLYWSGTAGCTMLVGGDHATTTPTDASEGLPIRAVSSASSTPDFSNLSKEQREVAKKLLGKWILVKYEFVGESSETYDEDDDHYVVFYDDFTAYVQPSNLFEAEKGVCSWTLDGKTKIIFNDDEDDTYSIIQLTSTTLVLGWLNDGKVVEKTTFTKAK